MVTVSTQTDECVKLNKHAKTIKVEKKVGASPTMNNSEEFVSSIATTKKQHPIQIVRMFLHLKIKFKKLKLNQT